MNKVICALVLVTFAVGSLACTLQQDAAAKAFDSLQTQGYEVVKGTMLFASGNSFGANPSSLYGLYQFQPNKSTFNIGPADAIVFYGCTPPPLKYFSFRSYVFLHNGELTFASLGDSLNHLVIAEKYGGQSVFDTAIGVVTTADEQTFQDVQQAFSSAQVTAPTFVDSIPSSIVNMGTGPNADTFGMLIRVAIFDDAKAGKAYTSATYPIVMLRRTANAPRNPYPFPVLRNRTTGVSESPLAAPLQQLERTVLAKYQATPGWSYVATIPSRANPNSGFGCIINHTRCAGDNHDAAYLIAEQGVQLDPNTVLVILGVNHFLTNHAVYSNVEFYNTRLQPVGNGLNNFEYANSATVFSPNATSLFAVHLARDCTGLQYCVPLSRSDLPYIERVFIATRGYLDPTSKTGPDYQELVWPVVLEFQRK